VPSASCLLLVTGPAASPSSLQPSRSTTRINLQHENKDVFEGFNPFDPHYERNTGLQTVLSENTTSSESLFYQERDKRAAIQDWVDTLTRKRRCFAGSYPLERLVSHSSGFDSECDNSETEVDVKNDVSYMSRSLPSYKTNVVGIVVDAMMTRRGTNFTESVATDNEVSTATSFVSTTADCHCRMSLSRS
jgi:hypothetical protein